MSSPARGDRRLAVRVASGCQAKPTGSGDVNTLNIGAPSSLSTPPQ
jgi:hypothetical protein